MSEERGRPSSAVAVESMSPLPPQPPVCALLAQPPAPLTRLPCQHSGPCQVPASRLGALQPQLHERPGLAGRRDRNARGLHRQARRRHRHALGIVLALHRSRQLAPPLQGRGAASGGAQQARHAQRCQQGRRVSVGCGDSGCLLCRQPHVHREVGAAGPACKGREALGT